MSHARANRPVYFLTLSRSLPATCKMFERFPNVLVATALSNDKARQQEYSRHDLSGFHRLLLSLVYQLILLNMQMTLFMTFAG